MICHRLMAARATIADVTIGGDYNDRRDARMAYPSPASPVGVECIGSRCALWVQERTKDTRRLEVTRHTNEGAARLGDVGEPPAPTGRGVCADNLRAEPWPDPAKPDGAS